MAKTESVWTTPPWLIINFLARQTRRPKRSSDDKRMKTNYSNNINPNHKLAMKAQYVSGMW